MGMTYLDAKILWEARLRGVSFSSTLTFGHLALYLHPVEVKLLRQVYYTKFPNTVVKLLENYRFREYSDRFLREFLGVDSLTILDFSTYEGAQIVYDMNLPVPENLHERFDSVIDAGSLEHIFNFPVAIANLMRMLKVGGSIFITTPCNNLCGHGFYQFSPELMFRIFANENGFELRRIVLIEAVYPGVELTSNRKVYQVSDPIDVNSRVGLISSKPILMTVEAKKTKNVQLFVRAPLQSDYVSLWNKKVPSPGMEVSKWQRHIFEKLPFFLQTRIKGHLQRRIFSFSNTRFYNKLKL